MDRKKFPKSVAIVRNFPLGRGSVEDAQQNPDASNRSALYDGDFGKSLFWRSWRSVPRPKPVPSMGLNRFHQKTKLLEFKEIIENVPKTRMGSRGWKIPRWPPSTGQNNGVPWDLCRKSRSRFQMEGKSRSLRCVKMSYCQHKLGSSEMHGALRNGRLVKKRMNASSLGLGPAGRVPWPLRLPATRAEEI